MNTDKTRTDFLRDLTALNQQLVAFKNQYPTNFGAVFRHYFGLILMVLAMWIFVCGYRGGYSHSFCGMPVLLGLFGFLIYVKRVDLNQKNEGPIELNNKIAEIEHNYSQYPDVQDFINGFRANVNAIDRKKKNMRTVFKAILMAFGILGAKMAWSVFSYYDQTMR